MIGKLTEWGYQALFSCHSSKKAGVAILFNNNFNVQIQKSYSDPGERFIISQAAQAKVESCA